MTVVAIESGSVRGSEVDGVLRFAGIPFAEPPVGELRWASPQPPRSWDGVRDATEFANVAIQTIDTKAVDLRGAQSEDCLYLNVWTGTTDPDAKQPVMFWIHGGGFLNGASSADSYDGAALAARGVTVVSINYRLGVFGFFTDPEVGANFAVQDWVAGLAWVKANVSKFGGDPDNVLIFGQSAGGAATRALLHVPSARGLFHRAVIQSAGYEAYAHVESPSLERSIRATQNVCDRLGSRDIEELRKVPAELVRQASLQESGIFPPEGQLHTPANLVWYPVPEGTVMVEEFAGWADDVPVMLGCLTDESRMFMRPDGIYAHPNVKPEDVYVPAVEANMLRRMSGEQSEALAEHFRSVDASPYDAINQAVTDAVWLEPAELSMQRFAAEGRTAFYYLFDRLAPGSAKAGTGVFHSSEIAYLFGHIDTASGYYEDTDHTVSDAVMTAWTSFARTGTPHNPDGTPWPVYDEESRLGTVMGNANEARPLTLSRSAELVRASRADS